MHAIADTSVLVAFSAVRRLDLLQGVFPTVGIPPAVFEELVIQGKNWLQAEAVQQEIAKDGFVRVMPTLEGRIEPLPAPIRGRGEREVITLALALNLPALIDDALARRDASRAGVQLVVGTLGILARSKVSGRLLKIGPIITEMRRQGIRFGSNLVKVFLERMGEM